MCQRPALTPLSHAVHFRAGTATPLLWQPECKQFRVAKTVSLGRVAA